MCYRLWLAWNPPILLDVLGQFHIERRVVTCCNRIPSWVFSLASFGNTRWGSLSKSAVLSSCFIHVWCLKSHYWNLLNHIESFLLIMLYYACRIGVFCFPILLVEQSSLFFAQSWLPSLPAVPAPGRRLDCRNCPQSGREGNLGSQWEIQYGSNISIYIYI